MTECGFPDHHPPPLQTLLDIMNEMLEWTGRSSRHVAVVHCLAGKGRTGVVCSCFLLLTGYYGSVFKLRKERDVHDMANHAIRDFWTARGQGVRFPSQALYIYYFIKVLRRLGRTPTRIPRLLPAKRMVRTQAVYPPLLVDALLTRFQIPSTAPEKRDVVRHSGLRSPAPWRVHAVSPGAAGALAV